MKLRTVKWVQCATKPNPENYKNCMLIYKCTQYNTEQF